MLTRTTDRAPSRTGVLSALALAVLTLALGPTVTPASAQRQIEDVEPRWVTVTTPDARLDCGPVSNLYAIARLQRGQLLELDGRGEDRVRVRYPRFLPALVSAQIVDGPAAPSPAGGGSGSEDAGPARVVTLNRPDPLRAVNLDRPALGSWRSVYESDLPAGTELVVIEPMRSADSGLVSNYLVRPPEPPAAPHHPHAYIAESAVRDATPAEIERHLAALEEGGDGRPAEREADPRRPIAEPATQTRAERPSGPPQGTMDDSPAAERATENDPAREPTAPGDVDTSLLDPLQPAAGVAAGGVDGTIDTNRERDTASAEVPTVPANGPQSDAAPARPTGTAAAMASPDPRREIDATAASDTPGVDPIDPVDPRDPIDRVDPVGSQTGQQQPPADDPAPPRVIQIPPADDRAGRTATAAPPRAQPANADDESDRPRPIEPLTPADLEAEFTRVSGLGGDALADSLDELIAEFRRTRATVESDRLRARLDQRLAWLELQRDARDLERRLAAALEGTGETRTEARRRLDQARSAVSYTVIGRLVPSALYDGTRLPLMYRVESAGGTDRSTLAYVRPNEEVEAAARRGRLVGIIGDARVDPALGLRVIDPTRLDTLSAGGVEPPATEPR